MPFAFLLPTTSSLPFPLFTTSSTHPSLPQTASTYRGVLKSVLKNHKRRSPQSRTGNLTTVLATFDDYIPYLLALEAGLTDRPVNDEEVDVTLKREVGVEWRSTLAATIPGREPRRLKGKGLDYEIAFSLHTLAILYTQQATAQILGLYAAKTPTEDQRTAIITTSTKHLLQANSLHNYLATRSAETDASSTVIETLSQTQGGLAALALAEATLLAVLKDDPYPAVVAQDRNKNDKDWMIKPPEIPKVRAHLFARLCLAAAGHAGQAEALLSASGRIDEALLKYVNDLRKTSRAKACRFFGINSELEGETGKGIAWLVGGKKQLGFAVADGEGSKIKGFAKFKKDWTERREDKKIEKGSEWGSDAGRLEELRVIEMLEQKWNKMNDTLNTQPIPPSDPLVANMPSGRDVHSTKPHQLPTLDNDTLARMRAPPSLEQLSIYDSSSDSEKEGKQPSGLPGTFPGSSGAKSSSESYF